MSIEYISYLLQFILITITVAIMFGEDKIKMVILLSGFSLVTAILYYLNNAPDVALAEAAIGSAIMPLLFIIAISKQNEFVVISHLEDDFLNNREGESKSRGYMILEEFTNYYGLKLKIYRNDVDFLKGIFRKQNVDLIIDKSDYNKYIFKGKETSILMNRLYQMIQEEDNIEFIMVKEGETDD